MELLLTAMDDMTTFFLTTPFAALAAVGCLAAACWVVALACSKAQDSA